MTDKHKMISKSLVVPTLDENIQQAANALSVEELIGTDAAWSLFRYGITGLVHACTMADARKVMAGETSFEDFIDKYKLTARKHALGEYLKISLPGLEAGGIFIPKNVYGIVHGSMSEFVHGVELFDRDYLNFRLVLSVQEGYIAKLRQRIIADGEEPACLSAFSLIEENKKRLWKPEDLLIPDVVERGFNLGKYLWQIATAQYQEYEDGKENFAESVSLEVQQVSKKLISYYSEIINLLSSDQKLKSVMEKHKK